MSLLFIKLGLTEVNILTDSLVTFEEEGITTMCNKAHCGRSFIVSGSGDQQYVDKVLQAVKMLSTKCSYERAVNAVGKIISNVEEPTGDTAICIAGFNQAKDKMEVTALEYENGTGDFVKSAVSAPDDKVVFLTYPAITDTELMKSVGQHAKSMSYNNCRRADACQYIGDTLNECIPKFRIGGELKLSSVIVESKYARALQSTVGYVAGVAENLLGEKVCYTSTGIKVKGIDEDYDTIYSTIKPDLR